LSISKQQLALYSEEGDSKPMKTYSISTALNGIGVDKGSGKTPLGRHIIRAKIGEGQPINTVFVGRRPTGEVYDAALAEVHPKRDWILTRILWLSGLEKGVNRLGQVDTMQRYIYLHGTPDSEPMGQPLSHGCVRMRNTDILDLFDRIPAGTEMVIEA
jgi:lipoprotein-anchoring transpeptidase ErfK/SrfK